MDRTAEEQGLDESHNWRTLRNKFNAIGAFPTGAHLAGMRQTLDWVEAALLEPALRSGKSDAIEWYYDRMEMSDLVRLGASPQVKEMHTLWRCALDRSTPQSSMHAPLTRLARAAALGSDPYAMLGFLQTWMWPRLGSRAPMQCRRAAIAIAGAAVLSLLDATNNEAAQAWQWLQGAWPQGVDMMLHVLASEGNVHVAPVARNLFEVRNVKVYQWMQARLDEGKWLHGLCGVNNNDRSRRLRFAIATLNAIDKRRTEQEKYDPEATWELDRPLFVQALADAFAWAWERPSLAELMPNVADPDSWDVTACWQWHDLFEGDVGQHADARLEHDPGALVDALCRFAASDALSASDHRRQVTWEKLYDVYVRRLHMQWPRNGCTHAMADKLRAVNMWDPQR